MKTYLGDSVYADISDWGELVLTTENGGLASNIIFLDGSTLSNLELFLKKARKEK